MAIYTFGSGTLWGIRTDVANSTPFKFGAIHDVSLEFSASAKTLYGQNQFPLAIARGTAKITGKAKFAQIQARVFSDLFFGSALQTGQITTANGEMGTVPATTTLTTSALTAAGSPVLTFAAVSGVVVGQSVSGTNIPVNTTVLSLTATTITLSQNVAVGGVASGAAIVFGSTYSVANALNFVADLGVTYSATGLPLVKVTGTPAAGQYGVSATGGNYIFAAADANAAVLISYTYTVAASGQKIVMANPLLGVQPVFQVALETLYTGPSGTKKAVLTLNACVSNKLAFATKLDDFAIPELDFEAFADGSGNVFTWSFNEAS